MARPVRRGKTGVVYFRKAVPKDLWFILGRREIKQNLRTTQAADAPRRHADLHHYWERLFEQLRADGTMPMQEGYPPVIHPALKSGCPSIAAVRNDTLDLGHPTVPFGPPTTAKPIDPLVLFDRMAAERDFAPATIKRHRPIIEEVAASHRDLRTITSDWCVAWKDKLIGRMLTPRTVQYAYLAALRNLMGYAVANKLIPDNPVTGISVKVKARKRNRVERGYSDAEARIVLVATMSQFDGRLPGDQKRARRWLPWICMYSGARIGEAAQLRRSDFSIEEGVWVMTIRPEAGTVKNREARRVPVHPHLIEQGLIDVIQKLPEGYVFADPTRRKHTGNDVMHKKTAENLGRWVRSLGLDDPELQPSHGWCHRFKTLARRVGMDPGTRDYMQGHAPHNNAESYGDQPAQVLLDQISLIPYFHV
ncbi:MAG: DUF6538 domain-containing protein [Devosia sp.]